MEKIINFLKQKTVIDIIILISLVVLFTFLFGFSCNSIFSDRGREFIFPLWITQGLAPYKDFVTIYFPFSYYLNALVYKILGVSINSLVISQSFVCMLFISFYYLIAREFLNRKTTIILSVFVLVSCVFNISDLFGYIIPYCYGRVYGILGSIICLYGIIKLHNTDNIKFAYIASFAAGFAASNKIEYASFSLFLIIGLLFYKKLKIKQYLNIILFFSIVPFITISLLFFSGVSINDIINAIKFSIKFSSTPSMKYFYAIIGLIPSIEVFKVDFLACFKALLEKSIIIFFAFLYLFSNKKYLFPVFLILSIFSVFILFERNIVSFYDSYISHHWDYTAFVVLVLFLFFYKNIFKDKRVLILLIATIFIGLREIFKTYIWGQGSYSLPLIILFIVIVFENYISKYISKEKILKVINFFLVALTCVYLIQQYNVKINTFVPLNTNKGIVYMSDDIRDVMDETINYIRIAVPQNAKIITLPEGIIFNYFLDRKIDNKCFMMDRLYYDAYGKEKALEIIKNANSDYILLVEGFDLIDFGEDYLYSKGVSPSANYIYDNYTKIFSKYGSDNFSNVSIYKKKENKIKKAV